MTAELIAGFVFDHGIGGQCLQLARQDVRLKHGELRAMLGRLAARNTARTVSVTAALTRLDSHARPSAAPLTDSEFFHVLGFERWTSVDASDFEGADIIHDLNTPGLSEKLGSAVDLALETGTAEHVFHLPHYLGNVCECLKEGGIALHFVPAHGYVDHGFYQFSPTLFHDFYLANRFDVLDIVLLRTATEDWAEGSITRYVPGAFDRRDRRRFEDSYVILGIAVRKRRDSSSDRIPQQRVYRELTDWMASPPADLLAASTLAAELTGPFVHDAGACWRVPAPAVAGDGDSIDMPRRSRVLLCEDGRPLGPAHANHEAIRHDGHGCFSHWGDHILFAAADGSDPNGNGRRYTIRLMPSDGGACAFDTEVRGFETPPVAAGGGCQSRGDEPGPLRSIAAAWSRYFGLGRN